MNSAYQNRMKSLLKEDYSSWLACMNEQAYRGFRVNLLKITPDEFFRLTDLPNDPAPFCRNGYYLDSRTGVGRMPEYAAGLFYLQEPSAGSAVTILNPLKGMKVLDLCAAPGSKSTQIAEYMDNSGLLTVNEINPKRASVLLENIERNGAANTLVLNSDPETVAKSFPEYFDAVLCDAPCSGEGMFRKDPEAENEWTEESNASCAVRQSKILDSAYKTLAKGGRLVYSTCTFSPEENEKTVLAFLERHPDMKIEKPGTAFGRPGLDLGRGTSMAVRIYPMDHGEGHFACLMKKDGIKDLSAESLLKSDPIPSEASKFLKEHLSRPYPYLFCRNGCVYGGTYPFISAGRCRILRHQVLLGEMKKDRFEPAHAMAVSSWSSLIPETELNEAEAESYLQGNVLNHRAEKGYLSVCWHHHAIGLAKSDGNVLKNHYPKKYRLQ